MQTNNKVNIFALEVWDDEGAKCTFYTVRYDDAQTNETDVFFEKYDAIEEFKEANQMLLSFVLVAIGEHHGARDELFNRDENEVKGLPVQGKRTVEKITYHFPEFPLRLYALKITNNIVILFNGGIKDGPTNQTSSLHLEWRAACEFAKRIEQAIREGVISVDETNRKLINYDGSDVIIL
ncbi:hypothetical protein [Flavobacterium orientale]|uniref:Uncharacterized protein n=1 Tax=Flavobacterium orientale TaxID=1756020 RepID=A0A917D9B6_9FLAO|nr:hypothetical protein [Flavobacterium orientale]GGD17670.1 hypothetical protein GCM10011343_05490 [Flavobacterium orientale]